MGIPHFYMLWHARLYPCVDFNVKSQLPDNILLISRNYYSTFSAKMVSHQTGQICPFQYTLPQKKRNFSEVANLLGKSVDQWTLGQMSFLQCSWQRFAKNPIQKFPTFLPGAFPLVEMTWGHWPWSRVTIKDLEIKVAFLLGKSVKVPRKDIKMLKKSSWIKKFLEKMRI